MTKILEEKINARKILTEGGCWVPKTKPSPYGYSIMKHEGKTTGLHILSYQAFVGRIEKGHVIHHKCENKRCFNPEHLEMLNAKEHRQKHLAHGKGGSTSKAASCNILTSIQELIDIYPWAKAIVERFENLNIPKDKYNLRNLFKLLQHTEKVDECLVSLKATPNVGNYDPRKFYIDAHTHIIGSHQVANYLFNKGQIKQNRHVHHLCGNGACWNPDHLVDLSTKEHGRETAKNYKICKNGHEVNERNTYLHKKTGWRRCRLCNNEVANKRRAKKKLNE